MLKAIVQRVALLASVALVVSAASTGAVASAATVSAPRLLSALTVANEHQSGYSRDFFNLWIDADGNGCDTRREVLIGEARVSPHVGSGCDLSGGRWWSAYDNLFNTNASSLDIDHFVPLAEAWRSGAFRWSAGTREAYANDLGYSLSLIAVTAHTNRSKSDADPARWMPPFNAYRCTYVATWVAIKWRWRLTIDRLEKSALTLGLTGCGAAAEARGSDDGTGRPRCQRGHDDCGRRQRRARPALLVLHGGHRCRAWSVLPRTRSRVRLVPRRR